MNEAGPCPECGLVDDSPIGIEYPSVYDGVSEWLYACGHIVPRFPPDHYVIKRLQRERNEDDPATSPGGYSRIASPEYNEDQP